jgi:hypothetical protein
MLSKMLRHLTTTEHHGQCNNEKIESKENINRLPKILKTHASWHTSLRELILQPNLLKISHKNKSSKKRENRAC